MNYESNETETGYDNKSSAEIFDLDFIHVPGEIKGEINLFALSTCGWCTKTRDWLEQHDIDYNYIYVDLTTGEEREKILKELDKYNPDRSFPTIVINKGTVLVGYDPDEMAKELNVESN